MKPYSEREKLKVLISRKLLNKFKKVISPTQKLLFYLKQKSKEWKIMPLLPAKRNNSTKKKSSKSKKSNSKLPPRPKKKKCSRWKRKRKNRSHFPISKKRRKPKKNHSNQEPKNFSMNNSMMSRKWIKWLTMPNVSPSEICKLKKKKKLSKKKK